jgi:hypothetical protein
MTGCFCDSNAIGDESCLEQLMVAQLVKIFQHFL